MTNKWISGSDGKEFNSQQELSEHLEILAQKHFRNAKIFDIIYNISMIILITSIIGTLIYTIISDIF